MKKLTLYLLLLFIFSCSSKDVVIEEVSFLYDKSNAQPSLVSNNGDLSLTWISSDQDMNANLNFRQFIDDKWTDTKRFANGSDWFIIGQIFQLMLLVEIEF